MKKLFLLFSAIILICAVSKAQYVDIPDSNFRNFLQARYTACFNGSGQMDTTCSTITGEYSLTIEGMYHSLRITDITGLKYFKNLRYFKLYWDDYITTITELPATLESLEVSGLYLLTSMPALPNSLKSFVLNGNASLATSPALPNSLEQLTITAMHGLTSWPTLPNGLQYFNCTNNALGSLPALPNSLKKLTCTKNYNLTLLPSLPPFLDSLDCSFNTLRSLPVLPSGVGVINCSNNKLLSLPRLPANLKYLDCGSNNLLVSLPELPLGLKELYCMNDSGSITSLPALPDSLRILNCYYNKIQSLPPLPPNLTFLDCGRNLLDSLPALPNSLIYLYTYLNKLHSLSALPTGLGLLECSSNPLYHLPVLPDSLTTLFCDNDSLYDLPALPKKMVNIICINNLLTSLPELPNERISIYCTHNNIHCLPKLPAPSIYNSVYITVDAGKINCLPNSSNAQISFVDSLDYGIYPPPQLPICNPSNNIHNCRSFPVITGNVYYDNNNNGIKDNGEQYKSNVKIDLSDGGVTYTNNNGYFEISADSIGIYTISVNAPNYFNSVPSSTTYNFTGYDTMVYTNYALQANSIKDSLAIAVNAVTSRARPGFSFSYLISYENAGTTTLSPSIVFNYDNAKLIYDSSSNIAVVNNGNNLSLNIGNFVPGQRDQFVAYFKVKQTAVIGDSIFARTTISHNSTSAADSNTVVIRGSFDPNDKQATPELSPLQVANGTYIDYTIRFQNTGTDTAFTVVVSDTLSSDLQANTLQLVNASHNCKTTIKDNIAYFEFLDILLPDSNANEIKSHGFVSFKIKPQPYVPQNTTITNTAAIFFDYNAPVITNTAGTFIKGFVVVPVRLRNFSAIPQTDNSTSLYWNTANEINTQYFVIEQGTDGVHFIAVATVYAQGQAANNYNSTVAGAGTGLIYYRLKIVDRDGSYQYAPTIKIDRRKNSTGFSLLTNPVKDLLFINTTDRNLNNTCCSIINTQGAAVKTFSINQGNQAVDIKGLPAGIYYLKTAAGSKKILIR
jgi:uncharacterized repeat protein (TIGR01451 family)